VANPRQRIHFGVHANDETARRAVLEFCAPGSYEAEVMPRDEIDLVVSAHLPMSEIMGMWVKSLVAAMGIPDAADQAHNNSRVELTEGRENGGATISMLSVAGEEW
jgi:hypothetical protein